MTESEGNQPEYTWDLFLAHAGADSAAAEQLYELLASRCRVFLDSRCLIPGDPWDQILPKAQREARITVVLISRNTPEAYYQKEEIGGAIALNRIQKHRVIPVYLDKQSQEAAPYGLTRLHCIPFTEGSGLLPVAEKLLRTLEQLGVSIEGTSSRADHSEATNETSAFTSVVSPVEEERYPDWGNAPDTSGFFGRTDELARLENWMIDERCRLITIYGMIGIGKSSLASRLCRESPNVPKAFDRIIWRSIRHAPPVTELMTELVKFLSSQREVNLPSTLEGQISRLLSYLREQRSLVILDGAEAILEAGSQAAQYRQGYEEYGDLFSNVGSVPHQSCLLLTTREKPAEVARMDGMTHPVRSLDLKGLNDVEAIALFRSIGHDFRGSDADWSQLVSWYNGNPLALELAAKLIAEIYAGELADFVHDQRPVFGDLARLLSWHFGRLSESEKDLAYWLAINREPVSLSALRADILSELQQRALPSTLQQLRQKLSLLRREDGKFTLQPVFVEYLTDILVRQVADTLTDKRDWPDSLLLLKKQALFKALSRLYVRESQQRLILAPIRKRLIEQLGSNDEVDARLCEVLEVTRSVPGMRRGYIGSNVLHLLRERQTVISPCDFSKQTVRQGYFQGLSLPDTNFASAEFKECIFTQTFGDILSVEFSPTGEWLAAGDINGDIRLWRVRDLQHLLTLSEHDNWVHSLAFSPDGKMLASGGDDQTVRLWNLNDGNCIGVLSTGAWVRTVAFSPDGRRIASCGLDRKVKIWDVETQGCIQTLEGHLDRVESVAFNPKDNTLISASSDQMLRIWCLSTGRCLDILKGHDSWIKSVAISPDGEILASGGVDKSIRLWRNDSRACVAILNGHTDWVWSVAFSPDSKTLLSGSEDGTLRWWRVTDGKCLDTLQAHTKRVRAVSFSADGSTVASGSTDQSVKIWNINDGKCLNSLQGYTNRVRAVAWAPDANVLGSASDDGTVRIWDVQRRSCADLSPESRSWVRTLSFSSNGRWIASDGDDNTIVIREMTGDKSVRVLKGHTDRVMAVAFGGDGLLVSGSNDKTIKLWDVQRGECVRTIDAHDRAVRSIAFSSDGATLATGSIDQTVKLWTIPQGELVATFGCQKRIWSVALSPDNRTLASASDDHTVAVWELSEGKRAHLLKGHSNWVWCVAFSPDGHLITSGSADRSVRLWDVRQGACLKVFKETAWVRSICFSPDGKILACGKDNGTISLWDMDTATRIDTLRIARPYEGMNITGATGFTRAQQADLIKLGAVDLGC